MKEIERVVTDKDHFDNRDESFLISTFWKLWKINILMQGSISKILNRTLVYRFKIFSKHVSNFEKNPEIVKFWEILLFQSHSTANLLPLAIPKKRDFFSKYPSICEKNPNLERFQKWHYFSRILPQICNNLGLQLRRKFRLDKDMIEKCLHKWIIRTKKRCGKDQNKFKFWMKNTTKISSFQIRPCWEILSLEL